MGNLQNYYQPVPTTKECYVGVYPVTILSSRFLKEEKENDKGKVMGTRDVVEIVTKSTVPTQFPDGTTDNLIVSNKFYLTKVNVETGEVTTNDMHVNAINGLARACGIPKLDDTADFEAKTYMQGISNKEYENKEGQLVKRPQFDGLFNYAPMPQNGGQVHYLANDYPQGATEEEHREWFKQTLALYKPVK